MQKNVNTSLAARRDTRDQVREQVSADSILNGAQVPEAALIRRHRILASVVIKP